MARLGPNLLGHLIDVVVKGDGRAVARPLDVDVHGAVLEFGDGGEPWHVAASDIARWRVACGCDLARMTADRGCPAAHEPPPQPDPPDQPPAVDMFR